MRAFVLSLLLLALVSLSPAAAGDASDNWHVVQAVGDVEMSTGGMLAAALDRNAKDLAPGTVVTTGASGRIILRRNDEQIILKANSSITLTASSGRSTELQQDSGTATFRVGKKRVPHFEVKTPYFAALVKGTVFTVYVDSFGAKVSVSEGAVEVSTPWRDAVTLVEAGKTARVRAGEPSKIEMMAGNRVLRAVTGVDDSWAKRGFLRTGSDSMGGLSSGGGSSDNSLENQDARIRPMINDVVGQAERHMGSATMGGGPHGERIRGAAFVDAALDGSTSVGSSASVTDAAASSTHSLNGGTGRAGTTPGGGAKGDAAAVAASAANSVNRSAQDIMRKLPRNSLHSGANGVDLPLTEILLATMILFIIVVANHILQMRRRGKEESRKSSW